MPVAVAVNIFQEGSGSGEVKERSSIAAGDYNKAIDAKIAEIKQTCCPARLMDQISRAAALHPTEEAYDLLSAAGTSTRTTRPPSTRSGQTLQVDLISAILASIALL